MRRIAATLLIVVAGCATGEEGTSDEEITTGEEGITTSTRIGSSVRYATAIPIRLSQPRQGRR